MKLTFLCLLMVYTGELWAQKIDDDQFPYLPHFSPPSAGVFASDSSLYLPLEPHTAIPYYAIKNNNKLPFQYLPPTGTKAPSSFPTQFPMTMSSSMRPQYDEDDDDLIKRRENRRPSSTPQPQVHKFNSTQRPPNMKEPEKREMRQIPRTVNYEHPIDRIDVKPSHFPINMAGSTQSPINQSPAARRAIIAVDSLGHRSDHGPDLIKAGSFPGGQFIHPGLFISSTTEPAIPIIRLSNEMDLDGSFSYEALGADQTHYVQHSRMENMGTDKEEQVVEGSYSYVGDNGQTYTVHYVADSNGFRATGDHLPVPPPMPEIIQRAVQYNLAEEAKRPPHLKSWQDDEKNYESDAEKIQRFPAAPPRGLFTGRTPEAFSYSFSPGNTQNNLATAANTQSQVQTLDFTKDQSQQQAKVNNGPISPQVTFLASQGAHVPSMNTAPQSIARVFTTEKSNMPQLMNYEAALKDAEQESNKALWRWQYGLNTNNQDQNSNKNAISRSSGDEVMINFNEMSPEQYTSMIHSQLEPANQNNFQQTQYAYHPNEYALPNKTESVQNQIQTAYKNQILNNNNQNKVLNHNYNVPNTYDFYQNQNAYQNYNTKILNENTNNQFMNEVSPAPETEPSTIPPIEQTEQTNNKEHISYPQSKILTHHDFVPPSQTVTKSYDYEDNYNYESRKIFDVNKEQKFHSANSSPSPVSSSSSSVSNIEKEVRISTTEQPILSSEINIRFMDFIKQEDDDKFRPVTNKNIEEYRDHETTTTSTTTQEMIENILENNIFLKNLVRTRKKENDSNNKNHITEEPKLQFHPKINVEHKVDKVPKFIQYQSQLLNDIKGYRKKTTDFSDILNFVAQKNHFESSKVKPKNKPFNFINTPQNTKMIYIPTFHEKPEEVHDNDQTKNDLRTLNHQQQGELHGIIKNYKVLQRNNNNIRNEEDRMNQLRRDLSPPPAKMVHSPNLPPLGRAGPSMKSYLPPVFV